MDFTEPCVLISERLVNKGVRQVIRRVIGVAVCGLGLWMIIGAVGLHVHGLRTGDIEYTRNIPLYIIVSAGLVIMGGAFLFSAWKLWRWPERLE